VVIALMGIFITFAGPAFNESFRAYKVRSAALELTDPAGRPAGGGVTRLATSLAVNTAGGSYSWTDLEGTGGSVTLPCPFGSSPQSGDHHLHYQRDGHHRRGDHLAAEHGELDPADRWTLDLNTVGRVTSTYSQVAP